MNYTLMLWLTKWTFSIQLTLVLSVTYTRLWILWAFFFGILRYFYSFYINPIALFLKFLLNWGESYWLIQQFLLGTASKEHEICMYYFVMNIKAKILFNNKLSGLSEYCPTVMLGFHLILFFKDFCFIGILLLFDDRFLTYCRYYLSSWIGLFEYCHL